MAEKIFVDGMRINHPKDGRPDWIKFVIGIKRDDLIAWLNQQEVNDNGYLSNIDVKESKKNGNLYAELDTWKPDRNPRPPSQPVDTAESVAEAGNGGSDSLPF
jgi:hypothetical protein